MRILDDKYWIGVDFGGTNIRVGLFNDAGELLSEQRERTEADKGPDYVIEKLKKTIDKTKTGFQVTGIGIGMPGPLDPYKGVVLGPVNLPGWDDIPLADILSDHFRVPCFIENDANVAALAEATEGAGKGYPIVFFITVSTGVGGGLCINGEIISGATGNAGEIGNIIVKDDGPRHSYLNPGSLEGMASGTSILRLGRERGLLVEHTHEVFSLAEEGSAVAIEVIEETTDALARGMAAIAHVVDPHIFVLGGGVSMGVSDFPRKVKEKFEQYIYQVMRGRIEIELAKLSDPGMIGAMVLAKKRIMR